MPHRSTFASASIFGRRTGPLDAWFHTVPGLLAALILCPVLCIVVAGSLHAATFTVYSSDDAGGTCPGQTCTLRQAIATAAAGDTIEVLSFTPVILLMTQLAAPTDPTVLIVERGVETFVGAVVGILVAVAVRQGTLQQRAVRLPLLRPARRTGE